MPDPDTVESDAHLVTLRSSISDLGHDIDLYKAKTGAALGGGVFLLLLAAGAAYDLITGNRNAWLMLGITRETLISILVALAGVATILLGLAFVRLKRRDTRLEIKLDRMEQEYAELLELRNEGRRGTP
jgi:membrane protein implicated in regulation of membrane protease activity